MKYRIFADRVKLLDSYLVPKSRFGRELVAIRNLHPDCPLWQRTDGSLKREWAAHNLAYALGVRRSKTKDVDLEYNPKWWVSLLYIVIGGIALFVVR